MVNSCGITGSFILSHSPAAYYSMSQLIRADAVAATEYNTITIQQRCWSSMNLGLHFIHNFTTTHAIRSELSSSLIDSVMSLRRRVCRPIHLLSMVCHHSETSNANSTEPC